MFVINYKRTAPPVISRTSPVMNELWSLAKKYTAFATSSGVPSLSSGVESTTQSLSVDERLFVIFVSMQPGATAFTLTNGLASTESDFVSPIMPALQEE